MPTLPPVTTLTEDQAVEELGQILDSAPDESDQLAFFHWKQNNAARAQQLEQHIARLQRAANLQDAPPQHLQPDPTSSTANSPMETPMPKPTQPAKRAPKFTPRERWDMAMTTARKHVDAACEAPTDRKLRQKAQFALSGARQVARETGIAFPDDLVLPDLPDAKRAPTNAVSPKQEAIPYEPPTPEQIAELVPEARPVNFDRLRVDVHLAEDLRRFLEDARHLVPGWVRLVQEELVRARAKFPDPDHLTLALAEEAGEVVKAVLDLRFGKPGATREALHAEIIQTIAMCVRLLEEGDPAVLGEEVA